MAGKSFVAETRRDHPTEVDIFEARLEGRLGDAFPHTYRVIDLFSGAGGLTAGFTGFLGHSFVPVWANDFNSYAMATYNENFGSHGTGGDILEILADPNFTVPEADVVVGGPPCQGFSLLNRNRDGDPRRHLWRPFMEVVERSRARVFVMENVPQLLGSYEHEDILVEAERQGFKVASARLCAADYGVPQTRWRAFIVGCKFADPNEHFPPARTHSMPKGMKYRRPFNGDGDVRYVSNPANWNTVRDAIGGLPEPAGTEVDRSVSGPLDIHFGRTPTDTSLMRYRAVPEGGNRFDLQKNAPEITPRCWIEKQSGGTDLFGRLWWDRPAVTIRTEFFKPEKGRYLHPVRHRPITHREAARLQSFPDDFVFLGSKTEIAKQIGNAVPPVLAARVADAVLALLVSGDG